MCVQVFFPMLTRLLKDIQTGDRQNLEETRVRASNLLCKVSSTHIARLEIRVEIRSDKAMADQDFKRGGSF